MCNVNNREKLTILEFPEIISFTDSAYENVK
jgi:hypothetical protein